MTMNSCMIPGTIFAALVLSACSSAEERVPAAQDEAANSPLGSAAPPTELPSYVADNIHLDGTLNLVGRLYFVDRVVEWYEPTPGQLFLVEAGLPYGDVVLKPGRFADLTVAELYEVLSGSSAPERLRLAEERVIAASPLGRDAARLTALQRGGDLAAAGVEDRRLGSNGGGDSAPEDQGTYESDGGLLLQPQGFSSSSGSHSCSDTTWFDNSWCAHDADFNRCRLGWTSSNYHVYCTNVDRAVGTVCPWGPNPIRLSVSYACSFGDEEFCCSCNEHSSAQWVVQPNTYRHYLRTASTGPIWNIDLEFEAHHTITPASGSSSIKYNTEIHCNFD
jgi:hypothetical protein